MENKRKFLFLYLNTGGGHKSSANVLKNIFAEKYPEAEIVLENGFNESNIFGKLAFEDLYHFSMNFVPGLFSFIYRIGGRWFQTFIIKFLNLWTNRYLEKLIKKHNPTDVVVFHFALGHAIRSAVRNTNPNIKISMVVTDPFTAHSTWFYEPKTKYYVFSEQVKKYAMTKCHIPEENLTVVPFLLNQKFRKLATKEDVKIIRKKYNLPLDKKIVLLTGGGEGLPNMIPIVTDFVARRVDFTVVVVCGRDIRTKAYLDILSKAQKVVDIRVYGFINFMDEIVKACDCAVIKAGPASLMEVLVSRKPVVINHFIYGQELGNVQFAIDNKVGIFVRKPKSITKAVDIMLHDEEYLEKASRQIENLPISFESDKLADLLMGNF